MSLILIFNNQTETIAFNAAFDEYCCIFEEICNVIMKKYNLNNLLSDYRMVYYDPTYSLWINLNMHVSKRITELIRYSTSKTLKIRVECRQKNITTATIQENTVNILDTRTTEDDKCAHLIIWLDEHIGNPLWHKQLKRDCRAMISTNISFITDDNIDNLIQCNSSKHIHNSSWGSNLKYYTEATSNYSCPFQCTLFVADNTDKFLEYLNITSNLTRSLSIIVSAYFAKEMLPFIISQKRKQLIPKVLFLYVLCSDKLYFCDWALGYIQNDNLPATTHLELFDDEKALFVRLLNDVSHQLTLEADTRRLQKQNWHALQYYKAARQLFLNSLPWNTCYTLRELDRLDQCIERSEHDVNESLIRKFSLYTIDDKHYELDDKISEESAEIFEY